MFGHHVTPGGKGRGPVRVIELAGVLCAVAVLSTVARGQTVKRSGISGTVTSASAQIPASSSAIVFTTPVTVPPTRFALTQVCVTRSSRVTLSGNTVGEIPLSLHHKCTDFTLAISIPAGETLTCANSSATAVQNCMVTGELSK